MSGRVLLLSIALAAFAVLTVEAIIAHGYVGFFELAMANWATLGDLWIDRAEEIKREPELDLRRIRRALRR